jgi:hypothetical protein
MLILDHVPTFVRYVYLVNPPFGDMIVLCHIHILRWLGINLDLAVALSRCQDILFRSELIQYH